jgi:hypothetical protein
MFMILSSVGQYSTVYSNRLCDDDEAYVSMCRQVKQIVEEIMFDLASKHHEELSLQLQLSVLC